jgi:hypothetical protein
MVYRSGSTYVILCEEWGYFGKSINYRDLFMIRLMPLTFRRRDTCLHSVRIFPGSIPGRAGGGRDCFLRHRFQTGCGAHPIRTEGSFPGGNAAEA